MTRAEIIQKMRSRVEQCRRLERSTTNERTAIVLRQIADEGEADIARMLSEAEHGPDQQIKI